MADSNPSARKLRRRGRRTLGQREALLPQVDSPSQTLSSTPADQHHISENYEAIPSHNATSTTLSPTLQTIHLQPPTTQIPTSTAMSSSAAYSLLLASLGNQTGLQGTRHSAGHILLKAIARHLRAPPFQRSRPHAHGQMTTSGPYTLWQSPTQMNISGPAVLKAWRTHVKDHPVPPSADDDVGLGLKSKPNPKPANGLGLIVLHDELESAPGTIKVRRGTGESVKGHKGVGSVMHSLHGERLLQAKSGGRLVRVGIGIGRPPSGGREKRVVSDYVLGTCTVPEREGIEALVGRVLEVCEEEGQRIATYVK